MSVKVAIISLGCTKNLIDSEIMMGILNMNKFTIIDDTQEAEVIIINTCGFIDAAKEESINTIIEAAELKKTGHCKQLIIAGCLSERYKKELLEEMPEIDAVVGTGNIDEIAQVINNVASGTKDIRVGNINKSYNDDLPRLVSTPKHTAYIKISEGCDNFCTYCIIPKLRGKHRSRKFESIINEAKILVSSGVKEIILIAQDTTKYGIDIYGEYKLPALLDELNKIENLNWIRILYMYPDTFSDELVDSLKRNEKVVKYVDMPIQHINNNVLKRMNRKTNKDQITNLINKLRKEIKDIIIRTTIIVGFPGESQSDFSELKGYIIKMQFDKLGVFTYSSEEGTPAAKFQNQIDDNTKINRQMELMEIQKEISYKKNLNKINNVYEVLIEEEVDDSETYIGRTYMDAPEIDGVVFVSSHRKINLGDLVKIKVVDSLEYDLMGEIVNEFS